MSLIEVKKDFSRRELMWFGPLFALFVSLICYFFLWSKVSPQVTYVVGGVTAAVIATYYAIPATRLPIYRGWMYSVLPIGFVISHVLLTLVYFLLFLPIGLLMRLVRYDPMQRKFDREAVTYWIQRESTKEPQEYFRQF